MGPGGVALVSPGSCLVSPLLSPQFLDDPGLKNDIRNKPVQLPLAHSGWLFKEEAGEQEDAQPWLPGPKEEKMELDLPAVKGTLGWGGSQRAEAAGGFPPTTSLCPPANSHLPGASERRAVR